MGQGVPHHSRLHPSRSAEVWRRQSNVRKVPFALPIPPLRVVRTIARHDGAFFWKIWRFPFERKETGGKETMNPQQGQQNYQNKEFSAVSRCSVVNNFF